MNQVLNLVIGTVFGAVLSLGLAAAYQDRWAAWLDRRRRVRETRAIRRTLIGGNQPVRIAGRQTDLYLIEGDGEAVIEPENITISVQSSRVQPPAVIAELEARAAKALEDFTPGNSGSVASWDSPSLLALNGYRTSRFGPREHLLLHLDCVPTTYAAFTATVLNLDNEIEVTSLEGRTTTTLRRLYFPNRASVTNAVRRPLPFLANGLGVALLAFTDDERVILCRRGLNSRARPGQLDVSVVEGVDVDQDATAAGRADPYLTAIRGCREELGVSIGRQDVRLLALGVDLTYYQWSFLGVVDLHCSTEEVLDLHMIHAKDRWEGRLQPTPANPVQVFERLEQDTTWDIALAAAYLAFCWRLGTTNTRRAAAKVYLSDLGKPRRGSGRPAP